jgi:hypothetical protein
VGEESEGDEFTAGDVPNTGLVVNAGEVFALVGEPSRVMYPASESDPSGVTWVRARGSGKANVIPPSGRGVGGGGSMMGGVEAVCGSALASRVGSDKARRSSNLRSSGRVTVERRGGVVQRKRLETPSRWAPK